MLVPSPSLFFFCGADDGSRTRCLHLGRVVLRLLSFIRSVCPGRSLAFASCALFARVRVFCLRWGLERMTGLEPATSTVAWWHSTRLSYIRMSRRTVLLVAFVAWALGSALVSIHLAYECRWCVGVSSTPRCCNIGHMLVLGRAVSVKPVPYPPGPSSPRTDASGSCVWFPSTMTKMVYVSRISASSSHSYLTWALMMRAHLLPR